MQFMDSHGVCLNCGHKKGIHNPGDNSTCQSPYCPCIRFKSTTTEKNNEL